MFNAFADFHHAGLLSSLMKLFINRLGCALVRPIGREWYDLGYWKIYDHPATVEQYLGIGGATPDGSKGLNEVLRSDGEGAYMCHDIDSMKGNLAVTHDRFMRSKIYFVIASIPQHIEPFYRLAQSHPNKPKLLYQIGNQWNIEPHQEQFIDGILSSAKLTRKPNKPYIEYHQEFDLDIYNYDQKQPDKNRIASFVNCFSIDGLFEFDWVTFQRVEKLMPDFTFKAYGGQCRDGCAHGAGMVADWMRRTRFVWHTKRGGDGYGHVIHNAFAMGRPPIVRLSYYEGKMAGDLMVDGETCIAIDGLSDGEVVKKIQHYNHPKRWAKLSAGAHKKFTEIVDFDAEGAAIRDFLSNL